jgi:hypothetical protein
MVSIQDSLYKINIMQKIIVSYFDGIKYERVDKLLRYK